MNQRKKIVVIILMVIASVSATMLLINIFPDKKKQINMSSEEKAREEIVMSNKHDVVDFNIEEYYVTNTGFAFNLFSIDENGILWGSGRNDYGQLGQGNQDEEMHYEKYKIAENVKHVDYGLNGTFVIYLTDDNMLYGIGSNAFGQMLSEYDSFDEIRCHNEKKYINNTPRLLMEDVKYAVCGKSDVVCLKEDNSVWTWGTVTHDGMEGDYLAKPIMILQDVVYITGGFYNHTALRKDGTLWAWGYNYAGNCGVPDKDIVSRPEKVAEDVVMVWTRRMEVNTKEKSLDEFGEVGYTDDLEENTVIEKENGTYWICGLHVGEFEKTIKQGYETENLVIICSAEFLPYKP